MTLTYEKEIPSTIIATAYAKTSVLVGLKREPFFSIASTLRLEATTSSSHRFMLSGIMPFVFSLAFPPAAPKGLLNAAKSNENAVTTTADTPTAAIVLAGLGTQICCTRLEVDEGADVCVGLAVGVAVGPDDVDEVGLGDVDDVGVGEPDVPAASDITETVPSPSLATKTSLLPES